MVFLKGEGSLSNVNLLVRTYGNNVTKSGKSQFLDVQVDHRDERVAGQSNLHLYNEKQEDGRYNSFAPYSVGQFEALKEAAGENVANVPNPLNDAVAEVYALKASVMYKSDGKGLVINTSKPLEASDFEIDDTILAQQAEFTKVSKQSREAGKASEGKDAPEAKEAKPQAKKAAPKKAPAKQAAEPEM